MIYGCCSVEPRYNPPLCGKKGGGQKNVRVSKTLRCISQRKLARKQNSGISMRKLAPWPRKWCVSGGISNSLRLCEMKDPFSTAQFMLILVAQNIYTIIQLYVHLFKLHAC